jgi:hypothetical protein
MHDSWASLKLERSFFLEINVNYSKVRSYLLLPPKFQEWRCKVEAHCGDLPIIKCKTKVTMNLNIGSSLGIGRGFLFLLLASHPRNVIPPTLQK